ncbi:MAG: thiolase domain-containing protein [Acidimicrobiia bacterium]
MIDVAVVATAQMPNVRAETRLNEVEMLMPVLQEVRARAGLDQAEIGFTCSGSTDYLSGQAFSFVSTLDGVGPWPPIQESHVEMDGAWALYEAWVKLQIGEVDTALVYCYGKSAPGPVHEVLSRQLDPYHVAPLWPSAIALAALQARAYLEAGKATEADLAEVAARSRRAALGNPNAQLAWDRSVEQVLAEEPIVDPLRRSDCPPITDGACAVILAAGDRARSITDTPAWIRGIDHRIEPMALGLRDLTTSASTATAGDKAGVGAAPLDVVELHAPFTHQELILRDALGLRDHANVNPSGGALAANPIMVAGLTRIAEVADRIMAGDAGRGLAHATSGPCLQQNLVCVLEGDR